MGLRPVEIRGRSTRRDSIDVSNDKKSTDVSGNTDTNAVSVGDKLRTGCLGNNHDKDDYLALTTMERVGGSDSDLREGSRTDWT